LRPGQLSRPIPVSDGVYLVYLRDKRSGGGAPVVNLKQVAMRVASDASPAEVAAAQQKLLAIKAKITGCANIEQAAQGTPDAAAGDLGEAEVKDLSPAFKEAAEKLAIGQVSDPIRTDVGLHLVAVCGRRDSAVQIPSREEVINELENQKLSMIAKREILNLRSSATIETR
jgi:peptidyl-prolyl cis-trans isomerase SurA